MAVESLGKKIRNHRQRARLSLVDLADRTGLSVSFLSQVERDISTASVASLKRIAEALGVTATSLWFGQESENRDVSLVKADQRKNIAFPHSRIQYQLLTPDLRRRVSILWMEAPPGTDSGESPFTHEGEDGVVVLSGTLLVEVAGKSHLLTPGDSIYFNAQLLHRWFNQGSETVQAIWVSTPPSF